MKKFSQSSEKYVQKYPNYEFHNKLATQKYKDINEINPRIVNHIKYWRKYDSQKEWKLFYEDLEYDHAFIQWIFPNFFKSMFNYNSYRLSFDELIKMKESPEIMEILRENTKMIEKFLGIFEDQHGRFKDCVVRDTHNRLRIRRILACLKVFDLKEECDNFLKTMIEKLQLEKQPQRFEYVIELFNQYDDVISLENVNLYLQEDIKYEKEEKDKFFKHFNFMIVENPLPQLEDQKIHDLNSNQHNQQQQNQDEINVEKNEIQISDKDQAAVKYLPNQGEFQDQNLQQAQHIVKEQQEQNSYKIKKDKIINMVQPKQVRQIDDFPIEEDEQEKKEGDQHKKQQERNHQDNQINQVQQDNHDNSINPQIQVEPKRLQQNDVEPKL